jgi:hypothetical protein
MNTLILPCVSVLWLLYCDTDSTVVCTFLLLTLTLFTITRNPQRWKTFVASYHRWHCWVRSFWLLQPRGQQVVELRSLRERDHLVPYHFHYCPKMALTQHPVAESQWPTFHSMRKKNFLLEYARNRETTCRKRKRIQLFNSDIRWIWKLLTNSGCCAPDPDACPHAPQPPGWLWEPCSDWLTGIQAVWPMAFPTGTQPCIYMFNILVSRNGILRYILRIK